MLDKPIIFSSPFKGLISEPKPGVQCIPEAYKKMDRYFEKKETGKNKTVKMCMPFLDAYSTGYIITFPATIGCFYDKEKEQMNFEFGDSMNQFYREFLNVEGHNSFQKSDDLKYDKRTVDFIFKFLNPWHIKTPPGYSCIFTTPLNQNRPFKIVDGIVDTDDYPLNVHFPFYWTGDVTKTYILEEGSPMVQVIPFKRESWKMQTTDENKASAEETFKWSKFYRDIYKKLVWKKKSYR